MKQISFVLYVAPLTSLGFDVTVRAGQDLYDHVAVAVKQGPREPAIEVFAAVNVDPSKTSAFPALQYGAYRLIKAKHKWKLPLEQDGFFVCKDDPIVDEDIAWQKLHASHLREDLPGYQRGGAPTTVSWINIHKGGTRSDASDGCITMPAADFARLYNFIPNVPHGYISLATSLPVAHENLKKLIERSK